MNKQQILIDRIHSEFDLAQDRLLEEARKVIASCEIQKITQVESIGERLKKVGFLNTPVVKKAEELAETRKTEEKKLVESQEQAMLIEYYKRTYPFLKFLTESELDRICQKYELVYAPVSSYVKDVPEKNLRDIEQAQMVKDFDKPHQVTYFSGKVWCSFDYRELSDYLHENCRGLKNIEFQPAAPHPAITEENRIAIGVLNSIGVKVPQSQKYIWIDGEVETKSMDGLFIAAPKEHFNLKGKTQKGLGFFDVFKTKINDPIVFRYVRGGIQVLTKWGLEANDPALVVPVLN